MPKSPQATLRAVRERIDMTMRGFAKALGYPNYTTYQYYESPKFKGTALPDELIRKVVALYAQRGRPHAEVEDVEALLRRRPRAIKIIPTERQGLPIMLPTDDDGNYRRFPILGDSQSPTLEHGDEALVDLSDRTPAMPGLFLIDIGLGEAVVQLEVVPGSQPLLVLLTYRNPNFATPHHVPLAQLTPAIIGRVIGRYPRPHPIS
jgi:hypothetical protein